VHQQSPVSAPHSNSAEQLEQRVVATCSDDSRDRNGARRGRV